MAEKDLNDVELAIADHVRNLSLFNFATVSENIQLGKTYFMIFSKIINLNKR